MKEIKYYTVDELMVVCLARTIQDYEINFSGVTTALPFLAMRLAKKTHAPNSVFLGGLQGAINPEFPFLPPTSVDHLYNEFAAGHAPVAEIFDLSPQGKLDRAFFGGGQIDKYGNGNNTFIGSPSNIKVKLPGGAGAPSLSCTVNNFTLWTSRHRLRPQAKKKNTFTLVDNVDFISTVGHVTPQGTRKELGLRGGGPDWLVTNMGVFDFDPQTKMLRLRSAYPGISLDEVQESTGFELLVSEDFSQTLPPTPEEVTIIREIDQLNVRKRLFEPAELEIRYDF